MIRRSIVIALVVAVLAVAANDAVRYVQAQRRLQDTTYTIARWAAENAPSSTRDAVANTLVTMAAPTGVTVTMYGQDAAGIQVRTETTVSGLIVLGSIMNLLQGKSVREALSTEPSVSDFRRAGVR